MVLIATVLTLAMAALCFNGYPLVAIAIAGLGLYPMLKGGNNAE